MRYRLALGDISGFWAALSLYITFWEFSAATHFNLPYESKVEATL